MIRLALLWHMHQPYYQDLESGEHVLPWVRLHAIKDYWGMVALLREFPTARVTFNLVPSLLVQIEAFAEERAHDRHLAVGLKPAEELDPADRDFLVANGFHAPVERMIRPFARYAELHGKRSSPARYTMSDLRDLQVWHKLVWVDPDWAASDPRAQRLHSKGRDYTEEDKRDLRAVELELLRATIPAYRDAERSGRAELSTSPFYHPILPLLCESDVHYRAHPQSALPRGRFARPDDAREQVTRAMTYHAGLFGHPPRGVWPSEGSLSDAVVDILADVGCKWTATDEALLAGSLGKTLSGADLYRPYEVGTGGRAVRALFRDHQLSDRIGFDYQSWGAAAAANDFVACVRAAGERWQRSGGGGAGEVATVTVILDGENAWEHYAGGGRPFLRALYQALTDAPDIQMVTMSDAVAAPCRPLRSLVPGSWINADFYIWAGHADDHRAWGQLAEARNLFEREAPAASPSARERAWQELLIAEGSDWFWWYGDDHSSDHDREFDDLFRRHLRNVYRALGQSTPAALFHSNITTAARSHRAELQLDLGSSGDHHAVPWWLIAAPVAVRVAGGAMHRVSSPRAGLMVDELRVASTSTAVLVALSSAELREGLLSGNWSLTVVLGGAVARQIELERATAGSAGWALVGDRDAQQMVQLTLGFALLGVAAGDRVELSLLVRDRSEVVIGEVAIDQPIRLRLPSHTTNTSRWLV